MNVLVIGRGSIGKKHQATLRSLSRNLSIYVFEPSTHEGSYYIELKQNLIRHDIDAAIICNPTIKHEATTLACLNFGAHVFLEKPLGVSWKPKTTARIAALLTRKKLTFMTGYDMRFNPYIEKTRKLVEDKTIGDVWGARVIAGQYLPRWRPGTDYSKGYGAKKALGGGVLLDLSHELDYLHWLLPKKIKRLSAFNLHTDRLDIETEDVSSITIEYTDRSTAHVQLDYLNIPYRRSLELYGDEGTILWDDNAHTLRVYTTRSGVWRFVRIASKFAQSAVIYKREFEHFFDCIRRGTTPRNSLANADYVMRLVGRAKESSRIGATVVF